MMNGLLQPRRKWDKDRPIYWRFGEFVCSGSCGAEFPNSSLRNAHNIRFHPGSWYCFRGGPPSRLRSSWDYLKLCLFGWALFFTVNLPTWHFTD